MNLSAESIMKIIDAEIEEQKQLFENELEEYGKQKEAGCLEESENSFDRARKHLHTVHYLNGLKAKIGYIDEGLLAH